MIKFEKVSRFKEADFKMPERKTTEAAGYDFVVAEDVIIPSYHKLLGTMLAAADPQYAKTLDEVAAITKAEKAKPTLVSTGVKCYLEPGQYLELSVRSSCPLKYWLLLANGVGIIDGDYVNNPDNEGEIFFQMINLSPFDIQLKRGDIIGQGIIKSYFKTSDDVSIRERLGGFGSTSQETSNV